MMTHKGTGHARIPSLDGLRAISILLVIFSHLAGTPGFPLTRVSYYQSAGGPLGVRIFFVISGYLITTLLLGELRSCGRISLRSFYYRRALRIFPANYAYLAVVTILGWAGLASLRWLDYFHAFTYTMNYYQVGRSWLVGHLWSLSVEEQFYLLWPGVLTFLGVRKAMVTAGWIVILAPLVRILTDLYFTSQAPFVGESFQTVADTLAAGCLLAGTREYLTGSQRYMDFLRSPWFMVVPCLLLGSVSASRWWWFDDAVGSTLSNLCIVLILDHAIRFSRSVFGRLLNAGPMVALGQLSYSLYLWQQMFLNRHGTTLSISFPANLLLAVACAIASYFLVEQQFRMLRWRKAPRPVFRSETCADSGREANLLGRGI